MSTNRYFGTVVINDMTRGLQQEPEVAKIDVTKPFSLRCISKENQSLDLCRLAVYLDPDQLQYAHYQDDDMCREAILKNGQNLAYVKRQTLELCRLAVSANFFCLRYAWCQDEDMCRQAINEYPHNIEDVIDQTQALCELAISLQPTVLQYIRNQTLELCKLAVRLEPNAIYCAKFQTPEMCDYVVQNTDLEAEFKFLHYQTHEACRKAVKADWYNLQYVKEQTADVCRLALKQDKNRALQFVVNKTVDLCLLGVKHSSANYESVPDKSLRMQKKYIKLNPEVFGYVQPQTVALYAYLLTCHPDTRVLVSTQYNDSDDDDSG